MVIGRSMADDSSGSRHVRARAHCIFRGKVQGVFFRANTLEFAKKNEITGWVCNLSDGTVEAIFEGPEEAVKKTIEMCRFHQPYARVDKTETTWSNATGEFPSFAITR